MTLGSALVIVAIIAAGCFVLWLLVFLTLAAVGLRKAKAAKADFDKGFDSDFFRRHGGIR